jgi:PAS domain S-box-containing protein
VTIPPTGTDPVSELAIDASPLGLLIVDEDGAIVVVNRALELLTGYNRAELIGAPVEVLVPGASPWAHVSDQQVAMQNPDTRLMETGRELSVRHKTGVLIPVEIGVSAIERGGRPLVLAAIVDVSDRQPGDEDRRLQLAGQLEFERLVADVSTQFINVPGDKVESAMREALGRIGMALHLDRCTFNRLLPDGMLVDAVSWQRTAGTAFGGAVSAGERLPWSLEQLLERRVVVFSSLEDLPNETDRQTFKDVGASAAVVVPLSVGGQVRGTLAFYAVQEARAWPPEIVHRLRVVATAFGQVLARLQADDALRRALAEVQRLKEELQQENVHLRRVTQTSTRFSSVIGSSPGILRVLEQIGQVAGTDSTVLLLGETGTGKELLATQLHDMSRRQGRVMVRVNCGAIPATLIESELFGREKGAFTGALARQIGRFELSSGSTIFLDEIGDLPAEVQVKLLRVLEERKIERLGSPQSIAIDTRIIAATHRDLEARIKEGVFREDLFYRLNVFPIHVPPLRERAEDIPLLAWRFVEEFSKSFGKRIDTIAKESLAALQQYSWPGNIRELRNVVERAMITATGSRLTIAVPTASPAAIRRSGKLVDVEREHIRNVLERTGWRIRGAGGAADRLGLKPTTLETRMAKLGLRRPAP